MLPKPWQELGKLLAYLGKDKIDDSGGDLDYILSICDSDGDGALTKAELLPALATWKQLLENVDWGAAEAAPTPRTPRVGEKPEKKSSACVLL